MSHSISEINQLDQASFVERLGPVFEGTPGIAAAVWFQRPFGDRTTLCDAMVEEMRSLSSPQQLTLIKAHPDLGTKAKMAPASVQEQASAGLDQLTPEEFETFQALNQTYQETFGFPFIIAVKHHTKTSILAAFRQRLQNNKAAEQATALEQIAEIARLRLNALVEPGEKPGFCGG